MSYEDALKEAKEKAKAFRTYHEHDGRFWIEVGENVYPYDWFIGHCARMRANGEI